MPAAGVPRTLLLLAGLALVSAATVSPPEQFKISYTENEGEMWISWARVGAGLSSTEPHCLYGYSSGVRPFAQFANTLTYEDGKCTFARCVPWHGLVFQARLADLPAATTIYYVCGDPEGGMSREFSFTTAPDASVTDGRLVFSALGDIGSSPEAAVVLDDMLASTPAIDFALQIGDIAYANGNQTLWDVYGRLMEPLSSKYPTLVSPGNHDGEWIYGNDYNRSDVGGGDSGVGYSVRYPGPGPLIPFNSSHTGLMASTAYWWSIDQRSVHLVAVSGVHEFGPGSDQYIWLEQDLAAAAQPNARAKRPWIIVTLHYPLYCTLADCFCNYTQGATCEDSDSFNGGDGAGRRDGFRGVLEITANVMRIPLEPLFQKYGVDLVITGHEHCYERTFPVFDFEVTQMPQPGDRFKNPGAPIHVMVGTGGSDPDFDWQPQAKNVWSAVRTDSGSVDKAPWGWVLVDVTPATLHVQFRAMNSSQPIYDEFFIDKQ